MLRSVAAAVAVLTVTTVPLWSGFSAAKAQSIDVGRELLATNCSGCHATEASGESPHAGAPPFRDLHLRYDVEELEEALVEGITAHPDMPVFTFEPDQAASIIAYLKSLSS